MKYASSIRYGGQLVEASECDYEDYKRLGLICPECKDAVFLRGELTRIQNGKEVKVSSHFAHFVGKDAAIVAQCESRVSSYTPKELQKMAARSRGQRLKLLQRYIWMIILDQLVGIDGICGDQGVDRQFALDRANKFIKTVGKEYKNLALDLKARFLEICQKDVYYFKKTIIPTTFDDILQNTRKKDNLRAHYFALCKLNKDLHILICGEVFGFLCSARSDDLLNAFVDLYFALGVNGDNDIKSVLRSRISQGEQSLKELSCHMLFQFIVQIPWADEFDRLQKQDASK